jgi:Tfp pilus assembly protein PilN
MIRINLLPARKKAARSRARPTLAASTGQYVLLGMFAGWLALGGVGYWLQTREETRAQELRDESNKVNAQIKEIRELIDEEKLQALRDRNDQMNGAIEKLIAQQRTPVFLMHEITNILTTGKGPDVDEEEQKRRETADPEAKLNRGWDGNSVWVTSLVENKGGVIELEGGARDASDLSEFVKQLRASRRFGRVSHPEYSDEERKTTRANEPPLTYITFKLNLQVRYWD